MNYYGPKELAAAFRTVRGNTVTIAEEIPETQYGFRATPETRTVGEMLSHIALSTRLPEKVHVVDRLTTFEGFDFFAYFDKLIAEEAAPRSRSQILDLLRNEGERFARVLEGMSEAVLVEMVEYPKAMALPAKSRFEMLLSVKEHEMHHRAQLMVMERMLGITPHLTRQMEEWIAEMKAAQAPRQAGATS